jgi:transcriptional regulator with XRE-family HTH domain
MAAECPAPSAQARKLSQTILQRLAKVKNQEVGAAIGKDHSTVSRIASGESGIKLDELQPFLASLGLKVVGADQVCINREIYESYKVLATAALTNPNSLNWDEPE